MTGVGNLSVNKIKTQIRQKQNVSFREMQMKLWGIKKMNASEKYWKKCNTQIDDIRHQKHFSYL